MAEITDGQLETLIAQIENETVAGANSKTRVATLLRNLKDSKVHKSLFASNDASLDTLQKIVTYIKGHNSSISSLSTSKENTGVAQNLIDQLKDGSTDTIADLKGYIDAISAIIGGVTPDGNSVTNTVAEILAVMDTYPEGTKVLDMITNKLNTSAFTSTAVKGLLESLSGDARVDASAIKNLPTSGTGINVNDMGYDIIIGMGQSNMVGYDPASDLAIDYPEGGIDQFATSGTYNGKILQASVPLQGEQIQAGRVSPLFHFAKWYKHQIPSNRRVLVIMSAVWATGYSDNRWRVGNDLYEGSITDITNALAACPANSRIAALLWCQGETDETMPQATYEAYFDAMITDFRSRVPNATTCPVLVLSMVAARRAAYPGVAAAHVATPSRLPYSAYVEGSTLTYDEWHYSVAGVRENGRKLAYALQSAKNNVPNGNTTPAAPTIIADDTANTLDATHALGDSEIEVSVNDGAYSQFNGTPIAVGNVARAEGYYKFRVKAATGRNVSPVALSPAFSVTNITPAAPTNGVVDDTANTFTFTLSSGYAAADHEYNLNNAGYVDCTSNVISVGDVAVAIGALLVRVKAATGRNASATLSNASAFTASLTQLSTPSLSATAASATQNNITVGSVTNAASYVLEWSANGTSGWTQLATTSGTYNHTGLTAATQYYYRAKAVGNGTTHSDSAYATASATTQAASSFPDTGLLAYWDFEETSGDFLDKSGNSKSLTRQNSVATVAGKVGNSAGFTAGSVQRLEGSTTGLSSGSGLTIAGWFKRSSNGYVLVQKGLTTTREYQLYGYDANNVHFELVLSGGTAASVNRPMPSDGAWYFICARWNGSQVSLSVNNGTAATAAAASNRQNAGGVFAVGDQPGSGYPMTGGADEVGIWNRALTDEEVTYLYNAGAGRTKA